MKTVGYMSSVTPVLPPSKTVSKSNAQDNIELHAVPCSASSTTHHESANNGIRQSIKSIVITLQDVKPKDLGYTPGRGRRFSSCTKNANRIRISLLFNGCQD